MPSLRFSTRTALIALTICSAAFAFGLTSTTHQIVATWTDHGVSASWQAYPGDRVNIVYRVEDTVEIVAKDLEVLQFVQHGDLADTIVVKVTHFQKWKLSGRTGLKWERTDADP